MKYLAQINFFHDNDLTVTDYPNIFRFNDVFTLPSEPTNFIVFDAETE